MMVVRGVASLVKESNNGSFIRISRNSVHKSLRNSFNTCTVFYTPASSVSLSTLEGSARYS